MSSLNTAESIASTFTDGSRFTNAAGERITDLCAERGGRREVLGSDAEVYLFADGSALAVTGMGWDVVGLVDGAWCSLEADGTVNQNGWRFEVSA